MKHTHRDLGPDPTCPVCRAAKALQPAPASHQHEWGDLRESWFCTTCGAQVAKSAPASHFHGDSLELLADDPEVLALHLYQDHGVRTVGDEAAEHRRLHEGDHAHLVKVGPWKAEEASLYARRLFLGGPWHGQRHEVLRSLNNWRVAHPQHALFEEVDGLEAQPTVAYSLTMLDLWGVSFPVFVLSGLEPRVVSDLAAGVLLSNIGRELREAAL